jgi:hypothetical protein
MTHVRIGHCSPDAPAVDVHVDGTVVAENVGFETISDYLELEAGSHDIAVFPHGETETPVIHESVEVAEGKDFTVLAINEVANIEPLVLEDENVDISGDRGRLRIVHASADAPAVDIFIDGARVFQNVEFGKASPYGSVDAGTYTIEVKPAGQDESVLTVPDVTIEKGMTYTAFATGMVSDDSLNVVLTVDHQPKATVA